LKHLTKTNNKMSNLNNDQRIRKGHKEVQALGMTASTILLFELQNMLENRRIEVKEVIKANESATAKEPYTSEMVTDNGKSFIKSKRTDFECCSDAVQFGLATNQSTLTVLETFLKTIKE
jgi:hypothetical protein